MPHRCLRTEPTTPHHQVSRPPGLYLVFPLNYPCHIYNLIYTFIALFFFPTLPNQGRFYKRAWCYRTLIFACLESRRNSGKHALVPSQICKYLPSCNVCLPVIIILQGIFFTEANARGDANQKPTHVRRYRRVTIHCVSLFTHGRFSIFQN